jgi:muramoyltetrapeptide carboxypeptidase
MTRRSARLQKPKALRKGSRLAVVSPSSPADVMVIAAGIGELLRLGFQVEEFHALEPEGYFAATHKQRLLQLANALSNKNVDGVIATRGGYGANYLLDGKWLRKTRQPKCVIGYSDLTILQCALLAQRGWTSIYGPMVASGLNHGVGQPSGYDEGSFLQAASETKSKWTISLQGESLKAGTCSGRLVGGCLTMLQTTLGTAFQPDTQGAILVLEDRGMKPYQVDRALRHLLQAGVFEKVSGILLGDFTDCDPPVAGSPAVREICAAVLGPLRVPMVYGAPIGHTNRPMLTIPLGVRAKLRAKGEGTLEILEPAVTD